MHTVSEYSAGCVNSSLPILSSSVACPAEYPHWAPPFFFHVPFFILVNVDSALSRCSWEARVLHTSTLKLVLLPLPSTLRSWQYCLFRCRKHLPEFVGKWMNIHFVLGKLTQCSLRAMNNAEIFKCFCKCPVFVFVVLSVFSFILFFFSWRRLSMNMFVEMQCGQSNSGNN